MAIVLPDLTNAELKALRLRDYQRRKPWGGEAEPHGFVPATTPPPPNISTPTDWATRTIGAIQDQYSYNPGAQVGLTPTDISRRLPLGDIARTPRPVGREPGFQLQAPAVLLWSPSPMLH